MASPQKENGYTPIANEILDEIVKLQLNGTQFKIILAIWRYTYGFNRKFCEISDTFLGKALEIPRQNVAREMKPLIERKMILILEEATFNKGKIISFNKDYESWIKPNKTKEMTGIGLEDASNPIPPLENDASTGIESDASTGIESDAQENKYKTNYKTNTYVQPAVTRDCEHEDEPDAKKRNERLAEALFEKLWREYPKKRGKGQVSVTHKLKLLKIGEEQFLRCIDRYYRELQATNKLEYIQHGSTFFNSGYVDYLDENYTPDTQVEQTQIHEESIYGF